MPEVSGSLLGYTHDKQSSCSSISPFIVKVL